MTQPLNNRLTFKGHLPINDKLVMKTEVEITGSIKNGEYLNVPLVMYVGGERKVLGEATIQGDQVIAALGEEAGEALIDHLFTFTDYEFSIEDLHTPLGSIDAEGH